MRFNTKNTADWSTLNYEGERSFKMPSAIELYSTVATAGLSDQFYETAAGKLDRIRTLIGKNDPGFVARLAVYAREEMNLRSIPLVMAVEMAKLHNGDDLVSRMTARIVQRADEITELLSYYALSNERVEVKKLNRLSKQMQKGLSEAFNKFDEYQFAKYNRDTAVKMRDALFLVHPKAKDEAQQIIFDKIIKDELETPYTWEVELSVLGQQVFERRGAKSLAIRARWEELIFSGRLGYMALLRNLRNILESEVNKDALSKVCAVLGDAKAVAKSRQLPFRFLSAWRELKELENGRVGEVLDALEQAVMCSAGNIKGYDADTKVVIAADVSGSM